VILTEGGWTVADITLLIGVVTTSIVTIMSAFYAKGTRASAVEDRAVLDRVHDQVKTIASLPIVELVDPAQVIPVEPTPPLTRKTPPGG
jgi:hypothetical protein